MSNFKIHETYSAGSNDADPEITSRSSSDQINRADNKGRMFSREELFEDSEFCSILSDSARKVRETLPAVRPNNPDEGNSEILIF
jgi:hypothetical protein